MTHLTLARSWRAASVFTLALLLSGLAVAAGPSTANADLADGYAPPVADVLDVDFVDGVPVDRAHGVEPAFVGSEVPSYSTVGGVGVMSRAGAYVGFDVADEQWGLLTDADGMTFSCTVRFDAAPNGALCGAASGGNNFGLYVANGEFLAKFRVDGTYYDAKVAGTVEAGQWYSFVGVFDGEEAVAYVNGVAGEPVAAPGVVEHKDGATSRVMIGANSLADGGTSGPVATAATYASMQLFSTALPADHVAHIASLTPVAEPVVERAEADILDVSFGEGEPVDRVDGIRHGVIGVPTYSTLHGTGIVSLDDAYLSFDLSEEKWDQLADADGMAVSCTVRFDAAASGPFCGAASSGNNFGLYAGSTGIEAWFRIGTTYEIATFDMPLERDVWHDVVGVYDGENVVVYVNGEASAPTHAPGVMEHRSSAPTMLMLGANPTSDGSVSNLGSPASYSSVRIFSSPPSAVDIASFAAERPSDTPEEPGAPRADVLDVDFASTGYPVDHATGIDAEFFNARFATYTPEYDSDALVSSVSGALIGFRLSDDQWKTLADTNGMAFECVVKVSLSTTAEGTFCGSASAGNNFYLNASSEGLTAYFRVGGAYQGATSPVKMEAGRWYDVIGVFDGKRISLYVDGELAATKEYPGVMRHASNAPDLVGINGNPDVNGNFRAGTSPETTAHHAMRVWSDPLTSQDVADHYDAQFGEVLDGGVEVTGTVPAAGSHLTAPVTFDVTRVNRDNAIQWSYALDGVPINQGQTIGAGLDAGSHTLTVTATSLLGSGLEWEIPFTSAAIPVGGGSETEQGDGAVTLSVIAHSADGADVTTTFSEASVTAAEEGFQGLVRALPTTLEFQVDERQEIATQQVDDGVLTESGAAHNALPVQRFDIEVPNGTDPLVRWTGIVDPYRSVAVHVWDSETEEWTPIGESRGAAQGETVVIGAVPAGAIDEGTVRVMVIGTDPFADDLAPRDASAGDAAARDSFEDPDDYDFSFVHWTDPQWLAQSGGGGVQPGAIYYNYESINRVQTIEERAVAMAAYRAALSWSVENQDERKISYFANTGDVTQTGYITDYADDDGEFTDLQYEFAEAEWDFTAGAFREEFEDSGLVNQVIGGNHDVLYAPDAADGSSSFAQEFSAAAWYEQADSWPAGASFHTMDETTAADGSTEVPGDNMDNNYVLFSAGGLDFVAVGLSYGINEAEAAWASSIFERYPDRNGILITHSYLNASANPDARDALLTTEAGAGAAVYEQVVEPNDNVFMVLAGHSHGVGYNLKTDVGTTVDRKHNVVEIMANFQGYTVPVTEVLTEETCPTCVIVEVPDAQGNTGMDVDGDGLVDHRLTDRLTLGPSFLSLLQFDTDAATVSIDNYSPYLDTFGASQYDPDQRYTGAADNLTLPVNLTTRTTSVATNGLAVLASTGEIIGEDTSRSGWPASVTWTGLEAGEVYAWTAASTSDSEGTVAQVGGVFVASVAGTDSVAPVLNVPGTMEITVGTAFDPMEGVTAIDNADGDVTSNISVTDGVDPTQPGSYLVSYAVADSTGNYATASRIVVVVPGDGAGTGGGGDVDGGADPDSGNNSGVDGGDIGKDDAGSGSTGSGTDGDTGGDGDTAGSGSGDAGTAWTPIQLEGPGSAAPGETIVVDLTPVWANQSVDAWMRSEPVHLGATPANGGGLIQVTIPAGTPLGDHTIYVYAEDGTLIGSMPLTVQDASVLAVTGVDGAVPALIALALILGGLVLVVVRKRSRV